MAAQAPDPKAFLGVGWAFPPQVGAGGALNVAVYEDDVRQAIQIILGTNPGERLMRPDFGAGLRAFVFEPVTTTTMSRLRQRVQDALVAWEARIDVKEVTVTPDASQPGKLLIDISYQVRATNAILNLVYPFYLEEGRTA